MIVLQQKTVKCMIDYSLTSLPAVAEKSVAHGLGPDIEPRMLVSGPNPALR